MTTLYRRIPFLGIGLLIASMVLTLKVIAKSEQDSARVTIEGANISIEAALLKIEAQTGFTVFYAKQHLSGSDVLSKISIRNASIGDALSVILNGKGLTWKIKDGGVTIIKKNDESKPQKHLFIDTLPLSAIKGTVTTDEGYPLVGASVLIKGTGKGTITNSNGRFALGEVPRGASIIITYTGYVQQEFISKDDETLVVRMKENVGLLDEQIVIAYGTSNKRQLTGNTGRVTSAMIEQQPISNPLFALQGRVSGVTATQQSGVPGGNLNIKIRGQNSLRISSNDNGNLPLYIVDGVPFNLGRINTMASEGLYASDNQVAGASPFNSINPADIESIEILKDADATAIYGSRGANGVILITTKKGAAGKMRLEASLYGGQGKVSKKLDLLTTEEYIAMRKEAYANVGILNYPSNAYDINGTWNQEKYTDWQKVLIGGTANIYDAELTLNGGSANTQYRIGGGYHKEGTVFPGNFADQRASGSLRVTTNSADDKFKSTIGILYSSSSTNLLLLDLTPLSLTLAPNAPSMTDKEGNLVWEQGVFNNPLSYTKRPYDAKTYNFLANSMLGYEVIKGLFIKASFGYTSTQRKEITKTPLSTQPPANRQFFQNTSGFGTNSFNSWIVEPQIEYLKKIESLKVNVLLGSTFQDETSDQLYQKATGFVSEALMDNISAVPSANVTSIYSYYKYRYNALFARVNLNYQNRYFINLTGRRDGSSRFGTGKQFGNFGAIGAAWIFSDYEAFRAALSFISYGKIRASYGLTGSDQIPNYGYLNTYTAANAGQYQSNPGLAPARLLNPDFAWETNKKLEIAAEFGLFKDRIITSASFYRNISSNQLVGYPLPPTAGFPTVQFNLPAVVRNSGFEFEATSINVDRNDLKWESAFNISIPQSKLIQFPNLEGSSFATRYKTGEPLTIHKSYVFQGVNSSTGLFEVQDADGNAIINSLDLQSIPFIGKYFFGGLSNKLSYKNFVLDVFFQFEKQNGRNQQSFFQTPGVLSNQPQAVLSRWHKTGDQVSMQMFTPNFSVPYSNYILSDAMIVDASFIRLKNVGLSYVLRSTSLQEIHISQIKLYLQAQNLFTITNYKGLDPETQGTALPPLRYITAGIKINL